MMKKGEIITDLFPLIENIIKKMYCLYYMKTIQCSKLMWNNRISYSDLSISYLLSKKI